jgi:hypothetical protein
LIFAEEQAMRRISMKMKDWLDKLHGFLQLNDRDILSNSGQISHELAIKLAKNEYDAFHQKQLSEQASEESDFEKVLDLVRTNKRTKAKK